PCLRAKGANRSAANSNSSLAWGLLRHPCSARCSSKARSPSLVLKSELSGWGVDGVVDELPVSVVVPVVGVVVWVMVVPPDKQVRTSTPDSGGSGVVVLARFVIVGHHAQLIPTADRPGTDWARPRPKADNGANRAARSPTRRVPTVMPWRVFWLSAVWKWMPRPATVAPRRAIRSVGRTHSTPRPTCRPTGRP